MAHDDGQVELFFGETTPVSARVYAVWQSNDRPRPALSGGLYGPFCEHARTLPARVKLQQQESTENCVLGSTLIPDPCYWSPAAPYYFRATLEIEHEDGSTDVIEREIGLRTLGARQSDLWLSARRWVLRGAAPGEAALGPVEDWHEAGAAMLIDEPDEGLFHRASRQGVLLVVDLSAWVTERAIDLLPELARWPAVGIVLLPGDVDEDMLEPSHAYSYAISNLLLGQRFHAEADGGRIEPQDWAEIAICEGDPAEIARRCAYAEIPVLAQAPAAEFADIAAARQACDRWQRDLAPYRDFAGYIVSCLP